MLFKILQNTFLYKALLILNILDLFISKFLKDSEHGMLKITMRVSSEQLVYQ